MSLGRLPHSLSPNIVFSSCTKTCLLHYKHGLTHVALGNLKEEDYRCNKWEWRVKKNGVGVGGSFTGWGMKGAFNSCLSVRKICNGMASFQMLQVLILWLKVKTKMYFVFKCTVYFSWQCHRFNSSCHCHENNMFILVQFFSCLIKNCMLWYMEKKKQILWYLIDLLFVDIFCCTFIHVMQCSSQF